MSRRKRRALRQAGIIAPVAAPGDAPLDLLLRMLRDPALGSDEQIELAKICLPYVHPRMVQLAPAGTGGEPAPQTGPSPKPQSETQTQLQTQLQTQAPPPDICDAEYMLELVRRLNTSMRRSKEQGREVSHFVWHALRYLPRRPADFDLPSWQWSRGFN